MEQNNGKGMSIAALILGIAACVLAWVYMWNIAAIVCGIVGLVLAVLDRKNAAAANASKGLGTAGLVLSIIGLVLAVIGFFTCTLCIACASSAVNDLSGSDLEGLEGALQGALDSAFGN